MAKDGRPIAYICSPYLGDVEGNVERARQYCRYALEQGKIPIAPHLLFPQFMNDKDATERDLAMSMDFALIGKCDEVLVFGNISDGMYEEIKEATRSKVPVRFVAMEE